MVSKIALGLLALSVALGGTAWRLQSDAAAETATAIAAQSAPVPQHTGAPPELGPYEQVVAGLNRSIAIRRRIESQLSRVESIVGDLSEREGDARRLAAFAGRQVARIARILGGAVGDTRRSLTGLVDLHGRLGEAARLARLIDRELAELDRKLGPSAGAGAGA